jgi:hypothetical protein
MARLLASARAWVTFFQYEGAMIQHCSELMLVLARFSLN